MAGGKHHMGLHNLPPLDVWQPDHGAFFTAGCNSSAASTSGAAIL